MKPPRAAVKAAVLFLFPAILFSSCAGSPNGQAKIIRRIFREGSGAIPGDYEDSLRRTAVLRNIDYGSRFENGLLDIILPLESEDPLPVIFWLHGGGYVGGDKSHVTEYAVQLAAQGFILVCPNYQLAPEVRYPTPLLQFNEAWAFFTGQADYYGADLRRVYLAGDSAGAQLAAQLALIQVSQDYQELTDIPGAIEPAALKGVLLFCGIYDFTRLAGSMDRNLYNYGLRQIGWAYLGEKDWVNHPMARQASPALHLTPAFPRTFITDGNTDSFEDQGREMALRLRRLGVPVEEIFFPREKYGPVNHEHQFKMDTPAAQETFRRVLLFLENDSSETPSAAPSAVLTIGSSD